MKKLFAINILFCCLFVGCGVSKAQLDKEAKDINNFLDAYRGKSVEQLLQDHSEVAGSLALGGGKVRHTLIYDPPGNYEYYIIAGW